MAQLTKSVIIEPNWSLRVNEMEADEQRKLKAASISAREKADGDLVGKLLSWVRGDGHAVYMVIKQHPLTLAHVEIGDGYGVEPETIRGLRLVDAERMAQEIA